MTNRKNKFGVELGRLLEFNNISIKDYAERIGTTSKNLIDIIDGRVALSFNIICNISFVSDIPASYIFNVEENFKVDNSIDKYLKDNNLTIRNYINKFNYKELKDKYNVEYKNEKNDYSIARGILGYLRVVDPSVVTKIPNNIFYKSKNDRPELLALWLERCYRVVKDQKIDTYKKENIYNIVKFIREEARYNRFNKNKLIEVFNKNGIFLAIETDLKGAKIRGAFRVLNNKPAVYITTKYKRCADVYFALLHELAHCRSDFNRAKSGSIVSFENTNEVEDYEIRADNTAYNWMVSDNTYNNIIINSKAIEFGDEIPAFVVYRLAKDNKIKYSSKMYQDNNKIVN